MKPETQYIRPLGFDAARFGFTDKMSTNVEQWLAQCANPAMRSAVETVFHGKNAAERVAAACVVSDMGMDGLPTFMREAIDLATSVQDAPAVVTT